MGFPGRPPYRTQHAVPFLSRQFPSHAPSPIHEFLKHVSKSIVACGRRAASCCPLDTQFTRMDSTLSSDKPGPLTVAIDTGATLLDRACAH